MSDITAQECRNCKATVAINSEIITGSMRSMLRGYLDITCPRCEQVNRLWFTRQINTVDVDKLQPDEQVFYGTALTRRTAEMRAELARKERAEQSRIRAEAERAEREAARLKAQQAKEQAEREEAQKRQAQRQTKNDDDDWHGSDDRSPNDDRSDSMNPNNDAYQSSMDNRSDQMNPNNDAYGGSRGR